MRLFSKGAEYAIRALMIAIEQGLDRRIAAPEICARADIPEAFARKGFQQLVHAGILEAVRGPGGGYRLCANPAKVSLWHIITAMDGPEQFGRCPLGVGCEKVLRAADKKKFLCESCAECHPRCGYEKTCPLHDLWRDVRRTVIPRLANTTLQDIVDRYESASEGLATFDAPVAPAQHFPSEQRNNKKKARLRPKPSGTRKKL